MGPPDVPRRLLTGLTALLLVAGCAGNASLATAASRGAERIGSPGPTIARPTPSPVTTWPPPAHRAQTIHLLEQPESFRTVLVSGCTNAAGCKGEQRIGWSQMLDATTQDVVGTLDVNCVLTDPDTKLYHCPANTITLTGRGQIVFDETVHIHGAWYPKPWPITAGTGEFLGATGSVTSPKDSTWSYGDFVITISG